jgi:hypothetical protein
MKWIKPVVFFIIGILVLLFVFGGCTVPRAIISPQGQIIERDGDSYLILWRDLAGKPHSYAYNWVYQPGISDIKINELEVMININRKNP